MSMPIADVNRLDIQKPLFAPELAILFGQIDHNTSYDVLDGCLEPSKILDQYFALQDGSHEDVKEYVIYFRHIMAFFADGTHCGLAQPKQFVAFAGHKDTPESIVLKENNVHIELVLNTRNYMNRAGASIHIEFPAQSTFTSKADDDYFIE
ncbi:MAG: malate synthase [Bermanella sp.]|jgi:malate synthase|uniref:malate synthase n=1 Tax=Glaciecola sp. 33A TaxID=2057807 RepID=UPI000C344C18|nr:malate synthase [Glaciecola sp. 33A]PKI00561.1 malate synthase [Glaciecola sp. 33A]